ncbi:MAG TPA: hypothetical protein VH877_09665 [Polyangia bacterium]|nr:hypothetical protein [Polyangia bacterium]
MRRTFAAHAVMSGIPLYTVKELLGHVSIERTERYATLPPCPGARRPARAGSIDPRSGQRRPQASDGDATSITWDSLPSGAGDGMAACQLTTRPMRACISSAGVQLEGWTARLRGCSEQLEGWTAGLQECGFVSRSRLRYGGGHGFHPPWRQCRPPRLRAAARVCVAPGGSAGRGGAS